MANSVPSTMQAIALAKFSKPSEYGLATLPVPEIKKPDEVLIKVRAAALNPVDVKMASDVGKMMDPNASFPYKLGYDVSGTIAAVGSAVTNFSIGEEVYSRVPGSYRGTLAEYALTPASFVVPKPQSLTHAEASSIPLVAETALQALAKANDTLPGGLAGKTVFIPAGLSGTGSAAVQIAKNYFKAGKVITTLSPKKIPLLDELIGEGVVDQVVDYTKGNASVIEAIGKGNVDFFFDTVGQVLPFVSVMKPKDSLILSIAALPSGSTMKHLAPDMKWFLVHILNLVDWFFRSYITSWWGIPYSSFMLDPSGELLKTLTGMVDRGEFKTVVGEVVKLNDLEAVKRVCTTILEAKGGLGKFVVEVD